MIKISIDEGYAYDMLSIALVKAEKAATAKSASAASQIVSEVLAEVGAGRHWDIVCSKEHRDLLNTNRELFELIDELNKHPADCGCYGCKVNRLNYTRFLCKRALQDRFFPGTAQTEQKLGYSEGAKAP